jgi:acetyl esterase/lipase
VLPLDSEVALRNLAWVEDNRRKVDKLSGGKLAYLYLPDTASGGYTNFNRYFFAQVGKEGAVIDERFNGGGMAADYIIDYLRRPLLNYWTTREGADFTTPLGSIFGPKAMIINEFAGSGGDAMPWYFRKAKIGPLVGKRTWGGLVGIYDYPPLLDGGFVTAPRLAFWNPKGEWDVENHGVAPDVEVEHDPQAVRAGHDPQLERAVQLVLDELKKNPLPRHQKPVYPNYFKTPSRPGSGGKLKDARKAQLDRPSKNKLIEKSLVVNVWPGKAPGETGDVGPEKFLEKKPKEKPGVKRLTNVSQPTLTIYRPAPDRDTGTAVVICPGGGYHILAWDLEGEEVAAWLNSIGVTGIILKYRVPRRSNEPGDKPPLGPLQDAQRALSLVRSNARKWKLEPDRIGILGFSAGGHLTASAATNFDKRAYQAVDDVDKVSCRPDFAVLIYPAYLLAKGEDKLAPDIRVGKKCPPMFFAHAGDDGVKADNSVQMYLALKRAGVPAELHIYAAGGHGFGRRPSRHPCSTWPQRCADWLRSRGLLKAQKKL